MVGYRGHVARQNSGPTDDLLSAFNHHKAGRIDRAEALYRRVIRKNPSDPDAHHLLGVIALDRGSLDQAIQLIEKALAVRPNMAQAHSNLGNALLAKGLTTNAIAHYRRAIELEPGFGAAYCNLGKALGEQGDYAAAVHASQSAVKLAPALADAHNQLGNALRAVNRFEEARAALCRAVELAPQHADMLTNLGNAYLDLKQFEEAMIFYRRALKQNPNLVRAHLGLATCLRHLGEINLALASYKKALTIEPNQAVIWNEYGSALRAVGRFAEAIKAFRHAISIDPDLADPYRNLASCNQLIVNDQKIGRVAALAARRDLPIEERVAAGFALGKALDDAERYDEAFDAYAQANRIYRDALNTVGHRFDGESLHVEINTTMEFFDADLFASVAGFGNPSELPVFIVGMPRSGTSLVEQIVASHSRVFGAGELKDVGNMVEALGPNSKTNSGLNLFSKEIRQLADSHLDCLRRLDGRAERIVDKMPDNIFKLGFIATLFPNARVILCRRDARDIGLSCYFQKFSGHQLLFSYDLTDCGRRFNETERMTKYWRRVLPLRMMEIEYESLVANIEGESRKLITFLGLDWEPACLDFHHTERVITTASSWQVRQPLYGRSVGRWRNYERHLLPLFQSLELKS